MQYNALPMGKRGRVAFELTRRWTGIHDLGRLTSIRLGRCPGSVKTVKLAVVTADSVLPRPGRARLLGYGRLRVNPPIGFLELPKVVPNYLP